MSPEKQRIAIAKAHGWSNVKIIHRSETNKKHSGEAGVIVIGARHPSWEFGSCSVPDYPNDLNACHEMEAWLKNDDRHAFACYASDLFAEHGSDAVHLTAAQRCEAFLRTLGLWEKEANTTKSVSSTSAATEDSSVALSESFRDGITFTRSYQVFLPTPKPIQTKPIFRTHQ